MIIPNLTNSPTGPQRSDPDNFREDADQYVDWHTNTNVPELNSAIDAINATSSAVESHAENTAGAATVAMASTNFVGSWGDLTGALTPPACVLHDNNYWMLVNGLSDVTASEPSDDNTDWNLIFPAVIGSMIIIPKSSSHQGYLKMDGSLVLKESYPRIADIPELAFIPITESTSSGVVLGTSQINAIEYGNGKFVCTGALGKIAYSTDGDTWTAATSSGVVLGTGTIYAIVYGNEKFVCTGALGKIAYSTDGDTWTAATSSGVVLGTSQINAIEYGNGKFVCVGADGKIAYSTDGDTWTAATSSGVVLGGAIIYKLLFFDSKFYIFNDDSLIASSSDGDDWLVLNNKVPSYLVSDSVRFAATDGIRMLFGLQIYCFSVSTDGVLLQQHYNDSIVSLGNIYAAIFADNKFVFVGTSGIIYYGAVSSTHLYLKPLLEDTMMVAAIKY